MHNIHIKKENMDLYATKKKYFDKRVIALRRKKN